MKRLRDSLDSKYLKICLYAGVTVILTAVVFMLLYLTGGVWGKVWNVFLAVLKPMILGGVLCYLLAPLETRIEKILTKNGPKRVFKKFALPKMHNYILIIHYFLLNIKLFIDRDSVLSLFSPHKEGVHKPNESVSKEPNAM